jgi:hypothetical protein
MPDCREATCFAQVARTPSFGTPKNAEFREFRTPRGGTVRAPFYRHQRGIGCLRRVAGRAPGGQKRARSGGPRVDFAQFIAPQPVFDVAFGPFWAVASSRGVNMRSKFAKRSRSYLLGPQPETPFFRAPTR